MSRKHFGAQNIGHSKCRPEIDRFCKNCSFLKDVLFNLIQNVCYPNKLYIVSTYRRTKLGQKKNVSAEHWRRCVSSRMTQMTIQTHLVPVPLRWMAKHHRGIPYSRRGCVDLRWTWMHQWSHLLHHFLAFFVVRIWRKRCVFSQYKLSPWKL